SAAVAQSMPNSTDFAVFRKAGIAGLNFAFMGGPNGYHTLEDTPGNLDLRTLQQSGNYALPLARRLANEDLSLLSRHDAAAAVFFNPAGGWEIVYPAAWARPLAVLLVALFLAVAIAGFVRGVVRWGGFSLALVLGVVSLLAAWRAGDWFAVYLPRMHADAGFPGPFMFAPLYAAALECLVAGLTLALWEIGGARWEEIALAGAGAWTVVGVVTAFQLPAASYLGVWPLVPVLVVLGIAFVRRRSPAERTSGASTGATGLLWLGMVPAVFLLAPLLPLLHLALGMSTIGAPAVALVVALATWLLAPVLAPRDPESSGRSARLSLIFLGAGAALGVAGLVTVRYGVEHPRPEWIAYVKDAELAKADWYTPAGTFSALPAVPADPWRSQYLTALPLLSNFPISLPGRGQMSCWMHEAPVVELEAPVAELLGETQEGDSRVLRVLIRSPRGAARVSIEAQAQRISSVRLNGKEMEERTFAAAAGGKIVRAHARIFDARAQRESWNLLYAAPPQEGIELRMAIPRDSPLEIILADISDGLPAIPGQTFSPRPPGVTQQHLADMTVVIKSFAF
ncbi:MAG TPA: M28 family peptidase, partial [Candidatus Acidoferrales bacterium]|nr:M28 family peptidase [Candidatus Acidoferrales bacterium]